MLLHGIGIYDDWRDQFALDVLKAALQRFERVARRDILLDDKPPATCVFGIPDKDREIQVALSNLRHERRLAVFGRDAEVL
jgi:hypothetical protein